MSVDTGIWVVARSDQDQVAQVTFELIAKAKELGERFDENVTAVMLGYGMDQSLQKPFQYGADAVIYVDEQNLREYDANSYTNVLEKLVTKYKPAALLFGADTIGRDWAPRIAVRLETGISADCIDLDMTDVGGIKLLIQKKPYLNGEVIVDIVCKDKRPQIATVKPGMLPLRTADLARTGQVTRERIKVKPTEILSTILDVIPKSVCAADICTAKVVVAGGRGFKTKQEFHRLYELADLLGGVVGATRPLIQEGWIEQEAQIGQSGSMISPRLYLAFGISGSAMHTCGVVNPGTVIAVNTDPEAPIFNSANYGMIGDCNRVVDSLINILTGRM